MQSTDRKRAIIKHLRRQVSVSVAELARTLSMNRETLRRDVMHLETDGIVFRHDGKIYLNDSAIAHRNLSMYGVLTRDERIQELEKSITAKGSVRVSKLSSDLQVTATTIRADLKELARRGVVEVHHGYATVPDGDPSGDSIAALSEQTTGVITSRAVSHIESGDTVFLDDSSFSSHLAGAIEQARDLTIITSSLVVANLLSQREYPCETFTLSGRIGPGSTAMEPIAPQPVLEGTLIREAVFGLAYLSQDGTFLLENALPPDLLQRICEQSEQVFLCVRSENVGARALNEAFPLSRISSQVAEIIVDDAIDNERAREILPPDIPVALCGADYVYPLRRNPGKRIGLSVFPGHFDFRKEVGEGIEMACKQKGVYTLHTRHNNGDYESIIDGANRLIEDGVDLIIDYSSNYDVGVLLAQKAVDRGVPLIMVDLPVHNAIYFGANNVLAGRIAGEQAANEIVRMWGGKVDLIVTLEKEISGSACKQRVVSTIDTLRERVSFNTKNVRHIDCSRGIDYYAHKLERYFGHLAPESKCLVISFAEDTTVDSHEIVRRHAQNSNIIMVSQNHSHHVEHVMRAEGSPLIGSVSYARDHYGKRIIDLASQILEGQNVQAMNYTDHEWIPNRYRDRHRTGQ